jgi:hypothetical protein
MISYTCFLQEKLTGNRYSMLPAITMNGVIYSHIKKGAYNGNEFVEWLAGLLEIMNPYPAPNSVLILDNCRIHHVEGVEELCAERYVLSQYLYCKSNILNTMAVVFDSFTFHHTPQTSIQLRSASHGSSTAFDSVGWNSEILLK